MTMTTLDEYWEDFEKKVLPDNISDDARALMRSIFFTGAFAVTELQGAVAESDLPINVRLAKLQELEVEIGSFLFAALARASASAKS